MTDESFIKRTLLLAEKAKGLTSPNPMVGAVIVKNGRIISEGYHKRPGTPHAEAVAIERAGERSKNSTLYVNLEPCCHTDKRTPPCTEAIIRSGIRKVVVAMQDPNPKVSGDGFRQLENAGIKVVSGIVEDRARRLNEAYIKYITTRKPFATLKIAMTLDGKIATPEGQSKWITGERSRQLVHRLRSNVDAVITAIGTVKADDPELTVRFKGARGKAQETKKLIRIVIDPNLEIPLNAKVLRIPPETIIVSKSAVSGQQSTVSEKKKILLSNGIKIIEFENEKLNLNWLMERLGESEITSVMIEGGSSLNAHALEDGVVDKVMFFIATKIIGGRESYPAIGGKSFRRLENAYILKDVRIRRVEGDILVEGYL